jgi:membrane protein DedA with SNARE-associated domain
LAKQILDFLVAHAYPYGYLVILLITVLETSAFLGMFVPGDTVVVLSGLLASRGVLKFPLVVAVAALGAIVGDNIGYFIGWKFGLPFLAKYGRRFYIKEQHLQRASTFFKKHGGKAVVLGRFAIYIRTLVPVVAGISRMNYGIFLFYNIVGGILWAAASAAVGFFFGNSWDRISRALGVTGAVIFFLAIIAAATVVIVRRRRRCLRRP